MRDVYDLEELLALARDRHPAWYIKEYLGLRMTERNIYRIIKRHLGVRPTQTTVTKPNILREATVRYMESRGLSKRYCSSCFRHGVRECAIRALRPDIDSFVFVCTQRCAAAGDY
jgi:hypothetical protein